MAAKRDVPPVAQPTLPSSEYEFKNPVDRYGQLSEWKRSWIERKSEEELRLLDELLSRYRDAQAVGRFGKWAVILIITSFVTAAAFGKNMLDIVKWFRG